MPLPLLFPLTMSAQGLESKPMLGKVFQVGMVGAPPNSIA